MIEFYDVVDTAYLNLCKSQTLNVKVRVELLDHYENTVGEITTKVSTTGGSINVKYNQGVRRTCDITISDINSDMIPNNENSPLFVNKKFKIYIGLYKANYVSNDDVIYWFSQGVFITKDCDYDKKNKVLHLTGVDKFGFFTKDLNQHTLQNTYHISADSKLGKLISDIITIDMGNSMPTDSKEPIIHTSFLNQVLPYDIEKTANETIGDILIEIATAFNADIYYDTDGHLVFEPNIIDDYNKQSPVFEFGKNDSALIDMTLDFNYGDIVNQITVTGDNTDGAVYSSTAKNENPVSSLRVSNIGIKAADIEETPMGYNEKRCADYANYLLKKKMRIAIAGTISCVPLPHLDCNKVVRVHNNENDVHETDFLLEEVQMPLSPEAYTLSVCNLQDLPLTCYTSGIPQSEISEWVAFSDTNSLGKYINRSGETFVIAPSFVNGRTITAIGGSGELEDGEIIQPSHISEVRGLQGIINVYIEDGINIIKEYAFSNQFYGINNAPYNDIETIRFPTNLNTIGTNAFYLCLLDTGTLQIPTGTNIGDRAFACSSVKSVIIENRCNIGGYAFMNCQNLDYVKIESGCVLHERIFEECYSIENVDFGLNIDFTDASYMFERCYNLTNVNLPNDMQFIPNNMFYECTSLNNLTIPNGVITIGERAFDSCYNLLSITISESVISIKDMAFEYCYNLKSITIPSSVANIGSSAFYECHKFESITIKNSNCEIYDSSNTISNTATIYGYANSTAQSYAKKYNRTFVEITE